MKRNTISRLFFPPPKRRARKYAFGPNEVVNPKNNPAREPGLGPYSPNVFPAAPLLPLSPSEQTNAGLQVPQAPRTGETAIGDVLLVRGQIPAGGYRWNPDLIASLQGWQKYEEMMRDDQIVACLTLLSATITGREWDWQIDNEKAQRPIANFFDEMFDHHMKGSMKQLLQYMFFSVVFGFAMIEKMHDIITINGKPYWGLIDFKARPQWTFQVQIDHYGNVIGLRQIAYGKFLQLDPAKFIHVVHQPELDPHYGRSMLMAVIESWKDKLYLQRMWNIQIERVASGTVIGEQTLPLDPVQRSKLTGALTNLQSGGAIVVPSGVKISVLQAPENHAMQVRVQELNKAIARALLQPTDLGLSQTHASGSQARSRTQMDVYYHVTDALNSNYAEAINEQVIDPLTLWNFGPDAKPPRIKFDTMTPGEKVAQADALAKIMVTGAIVETDEDEAMIRLMTGLPDRDYSVPIQAPAAPPAPTGAPGQEPTGQPPKPGAPPAAAAPPPRPQRPGAGSTRKDPIAKAKPVPEDKSVRTIASPGFPNQNPMGGPFNTTITGPAGGARYAADADGDNDAGGDDDDADDLPKSWAGRMDIEGMTAMFAQQDRNFEGALTDSANRMVKNALGHVRDNPNAKPPQVDAFTVRPNDKRHMNQAVKSHLQSTFKEGARAATMELNHAASKVKTFIAAFAVTDQDVTDFINSLAFNVTGDLAGDIESTIRKVWLQSIAQDLDTDATIAAIEGAIAPLLAQDGAPDVTSSRIATIVRTNNTTAFEMARERTFESPDLNGFVEAYEFSATMDDHTTDPCQWMDGKVYAVDSPVWDRFTPAVWYNCRSMRVPIVKGEDWTEDDPPPADLSPTFL